MDGLSLSELISDIDPNLFIQFRQHMSDVPCESLRNDQYIGRWLKARNWDLEKAEKMFRAHIQWKNEVKLDELLTNFEMPEVIEKYFPGGVCGQDKFGRPAFICPAGTCDVFGLMRSASRLQLALSRYFVMQKIIEDVLPAQAHKMGRPIDQFVILFDFQHMSRRQLWRPWLNFVLEMTSVFELNFPELMAVCFVLNAPSFFSMIFSLLKPLLSKETQEKIHILGSNYLDDLLKLFGPEGLPAHYGGTMRDPDGDPKCPSRICWGGTVPESYYHIQQPPSSTEETDDAVLLVSVGRGCKEYFCIGEAKPGDVISWEFFTESNDIAFSLWVEPSSAEDFPPTAEMRRNRSVKVRGQQNGGGLSTSFSFNNLLGGQTGGRQELRQVTQSTRVDCDLVPESGSREVDTEGTYYLLFDNSYSWTRAKRVWCKAEVENAILTEDTNNSSLESVEERAVDEALSEVVGVVCAPEYTGISTLDVDISALSMILLKALSLIRPRSRNQLSSMTSTSKAEQTVKTSV